MATTQPIRKKNQVRELAAYYLQKGQLRNYVLIVLGVNTALRISDILRLTWDDVYDYDNSRIRAHICITEQKTRKSKILALNKSVKNALTLLAGESANRGRALINNPKTNKPISRIQAYRIIRSASEALKYQGRVSCHSLRKTFGYHVWKSGVSPAVIMEIYNHNSLAVTRRYLGITQDEKDAVYLNLDLTI